MTRCLSNCHPQSQPTAVQWLPVTGKAINSRFDSPTRNPQPTTHTTGFTLIEMLTTVAALVIVLGLMVSLARDVRARSAERLTSDLLHRLDQLVAEYRARLPRAMAAKERAEYPHVRPLIDSADTDQSHLRDNALANNRELVRCLKSEMDLSGGKFSDLSIANYNEVNVLDAWGSPMVYMPHQHPLIGMAAGNGSFFFSAGPDRKYLTRQDNLYSYEAGGG